jgi:hypothetical protein
MGSIRKKPVRRPLSQEELAMRKFWEIRYVAQHLGIKRDKATDIIELLIKLGKFVEKVDYWNAGFEVNNHYLVNRDSGIQKMMETRMFLKARKG